MPPRKQHTAVAFADTVQVLGWRCVVNARDGKVSIGTAGTGEFKRWYYRLPIDCQMTRSAQCAAVRNEITRKGRGRGPLSAEDDYGDRRDRSRSRSHSRSCSRSRSRSRSRSPDQCTDFLGLEHDMLAECNAFVSEAPDDVRFSRRSRAQTQQFSPS